MKVHFVLQGKGGVGKSYVAALLAQYYTATSHPPVCIDTDPVNRTFCRFKALSVQPFELMEKQELSQRKFDQLIEQILNSENEKDIMIVDNGAASFVPLTAYMAENNIPSILREQGHEITIHTIIAGGQSLLDTGNGMKFICERFPDSRIVLWLNEYFGSLKYNGTEFEKAKLYKDRADRITALVRLPDLRRETFGRDIEEMLAEGQTFAEGEKNSKFTIMQRQRLRQTWRQINTEMEKARL